MIDKREKEEADEGEREGQVHSKGPITVKDHVQVGIGIGLGTQQVGELRSQSMNTRLLQGNDS